MGRGGSEGQARRDRLDGVGMSPLILPRDFVTLVVGNLALILVNRSWRLSVAETFRQRHNPAVMWVLGAASAILVLLLSVPWLRTAFNLGPIGPTDWLIAAAAGIAGVLWFEAYKVLHRR